MGHIPDRLKPIMNAVLCGAAGCGTVAMLAAMLAFAPRQASATQAFAQSTGLSCDQCHVNLPGRKLSSFGEKFKANGFKVK